jgi:hypothetical protein
MSDYPETEMPGHPQRREEKFDAEETFREDRSQFAPPPPKVTTSADSPSSGNMTVVHQGAAADINSTLATEVPEIDDHFCPFCHEEVRTHDNYCWHCGTAMTKGKVETCRHCAAPIVPKALYCYRCGKSTEPTPELRLRLIESDTLYSLSSNQEFHTVGRNVPQQNNYVDLDLGPLGQRKVSRQHARFRHYENAWFLEDLNSKGGTRIYNARLQPNTPVRLEQGMVIYFADIKLKIESLV